MPAVLISLFVAALLRCACSFSPRLCGEDLFTIQLPAFNLSAMPNTLINPESLGLPKGYSNGVLTEPGARLLFVAGQVGWNERQEIVSDDFVAQFEQALKNIVTVVTSAGGQPADIVRLVMYVTNRNEYAERTRELGQSYRTYLGKHFPAMVLVEVSSLLDPAAKVELEAVAALPS
jgi:enamine deaminase RidA (YjgF/YER057c/UK114 family)